MLQVVLVLWAAALGTSLVGFAALVVLQGLADRVRPHRRAARTVAVAAAVPVTPVPMSQKAPARAARREAPRQVAEPLAG